MTSTANQAPDFNIVQNARYLIKKGFFKQADELLTTRMKSNGAHLNEKFEWIRIALLTGAYGNAHSRIETVKNKPEHFGFTEIEIELLRRELKFQDALSKLDVLINQVGSTAKYEELRRVIEACQNLETTLSKLPSSELKYVCYCINLDEQDQKWERCLRVAGHSNLSLNRVEGLRGTYLPNSILDRFGKNVDPNFKGTLGCFISHYRAWEQFLDSKMAFALILEDDFIPRIRLPKDFVALGLPSDFDICWLNERMASLHSSGFSFVGVKDIVKARASPDWAACGGDAYLISRQGAKNLLSYIAEDGFYGDVDWRMASYSLNREDVASLPITSYARWAIEAHLRVIRSRESLRSFATSIGLFGTVDSGSIREEMNNGQHAHVGINDSTKVL